MARSQISCIWKQADIARKYRTAVSLHSHTNHSKESLLFIPAFAEKWPVLRRALERYCKKSVRPVDFSAAYWRPPLTAKLAFEVESKQIEADLGLMSLVSLTDHDSINAPTSLRQLANTTQVPISVEWSAPFEGAVFHLGVHNLPAVQAQVIMNELAAYTLNPFPPRLSEILSALHQSPEILLTFNHPLWDQRGLEHLPFLTVLDRFLQRYSEFIHAFELNAMRNWAENKAVMQLAEFWHRPLISGGDRHGREPSGAVNLTRAANFTQFVNEIRVEQLSHVLFMRQYAEPRSLRFLQTVIDVIRDYPEYPLGSRRWDDRVFHPDRETGVDLPLSSLWKAPPSFLTTIFSIIRLAEPALVRNALNYSFAGSDGHDGVGGEIHRNRPAALGDEVSADV